MDNIPDLSYDSIDRLEMDLESNEPTLDAFNKESILQFKTKWDAILDKYSKIDDTKESDEIDLTTGTIITDNGHIRNLKSVVEFKGVPILSDIWSTDLEQRDKLLRSRERRRKQLKSELKQQLKQTNLFCSKDLSPKKHGSNDLEDNIRLLSPSPKKPKVSSFEILAQAEADADSQSESQSQSDSDSQAQSITESRTESQSDASTNTDFDDEYLVIAETSLSELHLIECAFPNCEFTDSNIFLYQKHLLQCHSKTLKRMGYPIDNTDINHNTPKQLIVDVPLQKALEAYFPLVHSVPPLPLTPNCVPLCCTQVIDGRRCRKTFESQALLDDHRLHAPSLCSTRKPVYLCPMLGCGFMIEENYLEYRQHFIDSEHHIEPKYRRCFMSPPSHDDAHDDDNNNDSFLNLGSMDTGYDSIDELFSD
ncbi:uncharacterized protein KQ657_004553 [Scheffersomyces spartinae]|uniref:Uncharacterized protein n=1 Tax=Scheffersomyces spartinae TaxID=45513 RepID=A0A9P8AJ27_9ASCO|nr:uncharacterized protein KQ657_004553 [Scheffersomyces spartinae]KAG7194341.1 hypothetical protein KQ657_004553 [Scheffersomyces spartinae]